MEYSNILLYGGVFLAGLVFVLISVFQKRKAQAAAETWQSAPGVILSSHVSRQTRHNTKGGTRVTYRPEVTYQYQIMGTPYTGSSIGFGSGSYGESKANKMIAPYAQGAKVTVHYDPSDPSKAVLETRSYSGGSYLLLGIILWVLGGLSVALMH